MNWSLALNLLLIPLLGAGLFYAWRLQKTLQGLGQNRKDMEHFLNDFSQSITRAEKAIKALKETARDTGLEIDEHVGRAYALRDELNFLVDAADKIATRLTDHTIEVQSEARQSRETRMEAPPPPIARETEKAETDKKPAATVAPKQTNEKAADFIKQEGPTTAENAPSIPSWLRRANEDAVVISSTGSRAAKPPASKEQAEAVYHQRASKTAKGATVSPDITAVKDQPRSQAERELLQALDKIR